MNSRLVVGTAIATFWSMKLLIALYILIVLSISGFLQIENRGASAQTSTSTPADN